MTETVRVEKQFSALTVWGFQEDYETYMGTEKLFDIREELKKLPDHPGVYIMHDDRDAINLYWKGHTA